MKDKIKTASVTCFVIACCVLAVIYSKETASAVRVASERCLTVIIPSLYIFTALSGLLIKSGIYKAIGRPFSFFSRHILRMKDEHFGIFLISSFAGYPIGAKLISEMYDSGKIKKAEAERLLCVCYSSGPPFLIGTVGMSLFGPQNALKAGLAMFLAIFLCSLAAAFVLLRKEPAPPVSAEKLHIKLSADDLVSSVINGGKSMFVICAVIIFFAAFAEILSQTGIIRILSDSLSSVTGIFPEKSAVLIRSVFEISNISELDVSSAALYPAAASLMSFGGICVLLQIKAMVGKRFSLKPFLTARIFCAALSYPMVKFVFWLLNIDVSSSVMHNICAVSRDISPIPTVFLLIMTILLLSKKSVAKF